MKYDLVIENTAIIDGSGAPAFAGKVAAKDGKLYILPAEGDVDAVQKIDAKGHSRTINNCCIFNNQIILHCQWPP